MAIRDIILRGFGNGTFNPGVNKLPTRGYAIGAAAIDKSPFCVVAFDYYTAGAVKHDSYTAGAIASQGGCG